MTLLRAGAATDVGRVRAVNQDAILATSNLFVVADGMGGHAAGEVAASTAIATLQAAAETMGTAAGFQEAIAKASRTIYPASIEDPSLAGMGTTVVAACLVGTEIGDRLIVMNVGDSRAYRFRRETLTQITQDHSLVAEMVRRGEITDADAEFHPQRHVITRALGLDGEVEPDSFPVPIREGDRILLCSDGLTNEVDDEEIILVLARTADPQAAAEDLIARANAHGGADNISVVVVDVLMADDAPEEATAVHKVVTAAATGAADMPPSIGRTPVEPDDEGWIARRRRHGVPRALTLRVALFVLLVVGVIWGAWAFVRWYAMSSYYVASQDGAIVIYQGRPGGVLWFQPKVFTISTTTVDDVLPSRQKRLAHGVIEPSVAAAQKYIANLAEEKAGTSAVQPSSTPKVTVPTTIYYSPGGQGPQTQTPVTTTTSAPATPTT